MKKSRKLFICALIITFTTFVLLGKSGISQKVHGDGGPVFSPNDISTYVKNAYKEYIDEKTAEHQLKYPNKSLYPEADYDISGANYYPEGTNPESVSIIDKNSSEIYQEAISDQLLVHQDSGGVSWKLFVNEPGFYNVRLRYFTMDGYSSSIERAFAINGVVPFDGANSLTFSRVWKDSPASVDPNNGDFLFDNNGNQLKPRQVEDNQFRESYFQDYMGYVSEPYMFYLDSGENYLTLLSVKEPVIVDKIYVREVEQISSYNDYLSQLRAEYGDVMINNQSTKVEAEKALYKSSPTLYAITDRSSSKTNPYSYTKSFLNTIGGTNWKVLGDWITWEFTVPESGYYNISMRAKQNMVRGMYSSRKVYVDGNILFDELNDVQFGYSSKWQNVTLGNNDGAYLFYFEKGTHTITLEVTLGSYAQLIERIQTCVNELSSIYRQIISYTTVSPDPGRDYQLHERFPTLKAELERLNIELKDISSQIESISGTKSDKTGVIDSVTIQLDRFIKDNLRSIPDRLSSFSTNISSLGTILNDLRELPLTIDYIQIHTPDVKLDEPNEGFFRRIWDTIVKFVTSFFIDYSAIGSTVEQDETTRTIEVWMTQGRDQANVIRSLIDTSFKEKFPDINVELKLTAADVLLKATLAGIGPNVALNVDSTLPVNYALRNAVMDLTDLIYEVDPTTGHIITDTNGNKVIKDPDFKIIHDGEEYQFTEKNNVFMDSSIRQFQFYYYTEDSRNGQIGTYALPEKQIFLMMFVRDDIMEELGLSDMIPETWDDVINLVAELQGHRLQFYLPVNEAGANAINPIFASKLYQLNGNFYINQNTESGFLDESAMKAFEEWTSYYTVYSFPTFSSFVNRFRSGEQPIGIAYYEMYNTLAVFAPELKGKWSFHMIPGTMQEDGTINRTAVSSGSGCVMLKGPAMEDEQAKADSWEFMKWWTSSETQTSFGREMEGILGSAARHATANVKALNSLAWPKKDLEVLMSQWHQTRELPQIAGSYITGRELENAYRAVLNNRVNPRETLYDYANRINIEIDRKREEFGLKLRD